MLSSLRQDVPATKAGLEVPSKAHKSSVLVYFRYWKVDETTCNAKQVISRVLFTS